MTEIPYDNERRERILSAIRPLKQGVVEDELIQRLEQTARLSIANKADLGLRITQASANRDLARLDRAINSVGPWVRRMIDHALQSKGVALDDVQVALVAVRSEQRYRLPSGRGRSPNLAAESFLLHCHHIWDDLSQLPLPTVAQETTPFHVFCDAAIPDELRSHAGAGILAMVRRVIDPEFVRRRVRRYTNRRKTSS